jgi:hypothetical protein
MCELLGEPKGKNNSLEKSREALEREAIWVAV